MTTDSTHAPRRNRLLAWGLAAVLAVAVLATGAVLFRQALDRLQAIESRLATADARSQTVARQMAEYSRELEIAIRSARESRRTADESQAQRVQAEANAARAHGEADQARAEAQQAQAQAEELRSRRKQELDRMQEALNRIAPTRRTPLGMVVELANESFKFDFDKAALRPENREMLSRIAGVLLASNGYRLDVYGHTDDIGTDEYNQQLSERRAKAVADYLVRAGVPSDIVSTRGYGKKSPRVQAATRDARRVEIGIVDTVIHYQTAQTR